MIIEKKKISETFIKLIDKIENLYLKDNQIVSQKAPVLKQKD